MPDEHTYTQVDEIAELARRAAEAEAEHLEGDPTTGLVVRTVRDDCDIRITDLETYLPEPGTRRGTATLHDPVDFASYVTRLADTATTVWADRDRRAITAVFNDHDIDGPGWRDHTAVLALQVDPDWSAWTGRDGERMAQQAFAEFLEDNLHAIVDPAPADMLEVATTFGAKRNATFSQGINLSSGDVQLTYHEETKETAGRTSKVEVPRTFTLAVAPFLGGDELTLTARLRWRITDGALGIGYKLHRPDIVERAAFDEIRDKVAGVIDRPMLIGTAPEPLRRRPR